MIEYYLASSLQLNDNYDMGQEEERLALALKCEHRIRNVVSSGKRQQGHWQSFEGR